MIYFLNDWLIG